MASDDNIRDEDRDLFEAAFFETQQQLVERFVADGLPNIYLETVIARMVANRAAVADEPVATVVKRIFHMAEAHEAAHQAEHDAIREMVRSMRAGAKETKH